VVRRRPFGLAVVMVILLAIELTAPLNGAWVSYLGRIQLAIWGLFVAAFLVELHRAPSKPRYLRKQWLVALSLALPLLRIFRVVRALRVLREARAVHSFMVARVTSALNRRTRSLRRYIVVSRFATCLR
jgi:voltage-gated potassium channel